MCSINHFFARGLLLMSLLLVGAVACFAQSGNYYLTDHTPHLKQVDAVNFDIIQDNSHIIYVANRAGVLRYEGRSWELIETPSAALSLSVNVKNELYVGCFNGFGKLSLNDKNELVYKDLAHGIPEAHNIFEVRSIDELSYFLSESNLFVVDSAAKIQTIIPAPEGAEYLNIMVFSGQLLIAADDGRLFKLENNKLTPALGNLDGLANIYFVAKHPEKDEYVLGTTDNKLFITNEGKIREIKRGHNWNKQDLDIIDVSWVNDHLLALGTVNHGCVFIHPKTGKVVKRIDYHSGLPDNEIYAMYADRENGLWVSHEAGITRVAPEIPLKSFNNYPGLVGNLLTAQDYKGKLYVSTSQGVFYLDQTNKYDEVIDYVKTVQTKNIPSKSAARKKGLFRNRRKDIDQPSKTEEIISYERRVKKELVASFYSFNKVPQINSKSTQLIPDDSGLLVAAKDGIYQVIEGGAKLLEGFPLDFMYRSSNDEMLLASTNFSEVKIFKRSGASWESFLTLNNFNENINHITEDDEGALWLSGIENVYKLTFTGLDHELVKYGIHNPHFDDVVSLTMKGRQFFINSSGMSYYDHASNKLVLSEENVLRNAEKFIYSFPNHLWTFKNETWSRLSYSSEVETKLNYLNLFDGVRHIFEDNRNNRLWIITNDNKLFQYDLGQKPSPPKTPLFLKRIQDKKGHNLKTHELAIARDESSLTFSVIQPDFLDADKVEYRYLLAGLSQDWSPWMHSNTITYPFIPTGDYQLVVKSRNIFGQEQLLEPYKFEVLPPFWDQPWFYALEVLFFGGLLFLSIHFNRRAQELTWLSKLLTYITLVFIIEFLQTIGENKLGDENPVLNFFITAFIAMCIFPLEGVLRKFIIKEREDLEKAI